jgi:xylan 1,4-beta-xylosidase
MNLTNPILRGFFPDPSICRVGDDYYIATSTFEWFPGVRISHSRDLVHWRTLPSPLRRLSQLDMTGEPNSGGIWAPCLTYHNGLFYLIFTDVKRWTGAHKECHNYLVTCDRIDGEWSDPVFLNSSGFDPSLFHDNGRTWLVNQLWDFRPNRNRFGGIVLQEYDKKDQRLVGPVTNIFLGSPLGSVEGPHLLKKDSWYYLVVAEGGTFQTHAVTVARSRVIEGPYEVMPDNPLLTSNNAPENPLQSAGHGCFVETQNGEWYLAHLCRRPLPNGRSTLGRETSLQRIIWKDGWPRLAAGGRHPELEFPAPPLPPHPWPQLSERDHFDESELRIDYQTLRVPLPPSTLNLTERPGFLRLYGKETLQSHFHQALLARRIQAFHIEASTVVEFSPETYQQMAGLTAFYSSASFYYLYLTHSDHSPKALGLMKCERDVITFLAAKEIPVEQWERVHLKLEIDHARIRFFYGDGTQWYPIGYEEDASILSDEHAVPFGFTGAMVGVACQDLSGRRRYADFDWFEYKELNNKRNS